jgi:hypothetical protein
MALYNIDETVTANWDSMQSNLHCCGGNQYEEGYTSWEDAAGKIPTKFTSRSSWKNAGWNPLDFHDFRDEAPGTSLSVPDSCCHVPKKNCGKGKIEDKIRNRGLNIGIWKDGCIEILEKMLKRDLFTFAWVYIGVGLLLALVKLITVVLAWAYVAQINQ